MFHKVVWQHMLGVVGFLITARFIANLPENPPVKEFGKSYDSDIAMSMVSLFSWNTVFYDIG